MAFRIKKWMMWTALALVFVVVLASVGSKAAEVGSCPGSQVYCPGVGCVSGMDKCQSGNSGGASAVFSKETFTNQCRSMKPCAGGTRTDGPCLMDFPSSK